MRTAGHHREQRVSIHRNALRVGDATRINPHLSEAAAGEVFSTRVVLRHNLEGYGQPRNAEVYSVRAPSNAADGLHGLNPRNTGRGLTLRRADAALMQRLRQGARERDGQERAHRPTASLMALGPTCTEAAAGWSGQAFTGHPAEPLEQRA